MTRVTPLPGDLAKLTRTVGSTIAVAASPARSSQILKNVSWSSTVRARKELEHQPASERSLTTTHRPQPMPLPSPSRTIPLMQAFHTTPPTHAQSDISTIDYAFLPNLSSAAATGPLDQSAYIRIPLLPDNFHPDRAPTLFAPEAVDEPLRQPEIVAADPDNVSAVSALTEVEGMGPDGVELSFAHGFGGGGSAPADQPYAGGMLTDLWKGLVEDVMGSSGGKMKPAL